MQVSPRKMAGAGKAGFTLIELMVVILVIAVLAALTLSALSRGRESASAMRCLGNLQQIGLAISAYAGDNDGRLPGPLLEMQSNNISLTEPGSLLWMLKRYLQVEGADGRVLQAGAFTCPSWEAKDKSRTSAVFKMNFLDRLPEMDNRVPWGASGSEPVRMVNLVGWNPKPGVRASVALAEIWAMQDGDFAPEPGRSVHGDFRNALFYDWHAGRVNLRNEAK